MLTLVASSSSSMIGPHFTCSTEYFEYQIGSHASLKSTKNSANLVFLAPVVGLIFIVSSILVYTSVSCKLSQCDSAPERLTLFFFFGVVKEPTL